MRRLSVAIFEVEGRGDRRSGVEKSSIRPVLLRRKGKIRRNRAWKDCIRSWFGIDSAASEAFIGISEEESDNLRISDPGCGVMLLLVFFYKRTVSGGHLALGFGETTSLRHASIDNFMCLVDVEEDLFESTMNQLPDRCLHRKNCKLIHQKKNRYFNVRRHLQPRSAC